ncbi:MAG: hypothetical protein H6597_00170 [Flavobacteriales bacterium]|nr:hypothetical protein [Flavobacteriales bacterium]MCB9192920.1 hypothetical protein [Flavobacteriales bacterium]
MFDRKAWLIVIALFAVPVVTHAQDEGVSRKQQEKILAKKEKQKKKEQARKEKEDRKQHLAIQDKDTRRRIKQHTRRADRHGPGRHRDPFLKRLFSR